MPKIISGNSQVGGFAAFAPKSSANKTSEDYSVFLKSIPTLTPEEADKLDDKGKVKVSGFVECANSLEARGVSRRISTALEKMNKDPKDPNVIRKWTGGENNRFVIVQLIAPKAEDTDDDESESHDIEDEETTATEA